MKIARFKVDGTTRYRVVDGDKLCEPSDEFRSHFKDLRPVECDGNVGSVWRSLHCAGVVEAW